MDPEVEWAEILSCPDVESRAVVRTTFRILRGASRRALSPRAVGTPAIYPPAVPADVAPGVEWPLATSRRGGRGRTRLVCLLPARNCIEDLPDYFASVAVFADAVIALDDGSTDATGTFLESHPMVSVLLRNERRSTYAGWDDADNRNRLLEAATAEDPAWIVSVDADERIPNDDGEALRRFIEAEAQPGYAYGFNRYRMIDDLAHFDLIEQRAWRLFAFVPGQRFPDRRLHIFPVPTDIPRRRWIPTSVRIQHVVAITEARRQARWAKFREADPDCEWESDYGYTRSPPAEKRPWPRRPIGLPVVALGPDSERRAEYESLDSALADRD